MDRNPGSKLEMGQYFDDMVHRSVLDADLSMTCRYQRFRTYSRLFHYDKVHQGSAAASDDDEVKGGRYDDHDHDREHFKKTSIEGFGGPPIVC